MTSASYSKWQVYTSSLKRVRQLLSNDLCNFSQMANVRTLSQTTTLRASPMTNIRAFSQMKTVGTLSQLTNVCTLFSTLFQMIIAPTLSNDECPRLLSKHASNRKPGCRIPGKALHSCMHWEARRHRAWLGCSDVTRIVDHQATPCITISPTILLPPGDEGVFFTHTLFLSQQY